MLLLPVLLAEAVRQCPPHTAVLGMSHSQASNVLPGLTLLLQ